MKNYYRVMLGKKSVHAADCIAGEFIGADFGIDHDLAGKLPETLRTFNEQYVPIYLSTHPDKSKVAAGLACGALYTVSKGIRRGDIVLSPDGSGSYRVGEVVGDYYYAPGSILPHRRPVKWLAQSVDRAEMSSALRNSSGSIGTVSDVSRYAEEIERLIGAGAAPVLVATDPEVEDAAAFALEKHLEDFLVTNWAQTELGKDFDIFTEEDEIVGQQYPSDTGPIDILAVSKDKRTLLVVELKKGRASDVVVGQILRYMGYVREELAEPGQSVRGVIIALEGDLRIQRALSVVQQVAFYQYKINFQLTKVTQ